MIASGLACDELACEELAWEELAWEELGVVYAISASVLVLTPTLASTLASGLALVWASSSALTLASI